MRTDRVSAGLLSWSMIFAILLAPVSVFAEEIINGAFVVRPAKIELSIAPGATVSRNITVANGSLAPLEVSVEYVDVDPKKEVKNGEEPVVLGASPNSDQSLKRFITFPEKPFTILSNTEEQIPISVTIPKSESPGGRFGALVIKSHPAMRATLSDQAVSVANQIAVLCYVRIEGDVHEEGKLLQFEIEGGKRTVFSPDQNSPLFFLITYQNTGTVHLNPYGRLTLSSLFGDPIVMTIDPWAVYPGAIRSRDVAVVSGVTPGFYRAQLEMNRGYQDIVDTANTWVVVLPNSTGWIWVIISVLIIAYLIRRSIRLSRNFVT